MFQSIVDAAKQLAGHVWRLTSPRNNSNNNHNHVNINVNPFQTSASKTAIDETTVHGPNNPHTQLLRTLTTFRQWTVKDEETCTSFEVQLQWTNDLSEMKLINTVDNTISLHASIDLIDCCPGYHNPIISTVLATLPVSTLFTVYYEFSPNFPFYFQCSSESEVSQWVHAIQYLKEYFSSEQRLRLMKLHNSSHSLATSSLSLSSIQRKEKFPMYKRTLSSEDWQTIQSILNSTYPSSASPTNVRKIKEKHMCELITGQVFMSFADRNSTGEQCYFSLSNDLQQIHWGNQPEHFTHSVSAKSLTEIQVGQFCQLFGKEKFCFSLVFNAHPTSTLLLEKLLSPTHLFDSSYSLHLSCDNSTIRSSFLSSLIWLIEFHSSITSPIETHHLCSMSTDLQWENCFAEELIEIQEKIGQGGFASVYKGIMKLTGSIIAIKQFHRLPKRASTKQAALTSASIRNELHILQHIRHDCIVSYFGSVLNRNDELILLMELCERGSLKQFLETCKVQIRENDIAYILYAVLRALQYLHSQDIIHCDVKVANILVNSSGQIKLTDFGISTEHGHSIVDDDLNQSNEQQQNDSPVTPTQSAVSPSSVNSSSSSSSNNSISSRTPTPTQQQTITGTALYLPAECLRGSAPTAKSDVYAVGICAIELAAKEAPFSHLNSFATIAYQIINSPSPSLLVHASNYSASKQFQSFVNRCVEKDVNKRATVDELLQHEFFTSKSNLDSPSDSFRFLMETGCYPFLHASARHNLFEKESDIDSTETVNETVATTNLISASSTLKSSPSRTHHFAVPSLPFKRSHSTTVTESLTSNHQAKRRKANQSNSKLQHQDDWQINSSLKSIQEYSKTSAVQLQEVIEELQQLDETSPMNDDKPTISKTAFIKPSLSINPSADSSVTGFYRNLQSQLIELPDTLPQHKPRLSLTIDVSNEDEEGNSSGFNAQQSYIVNSDGSVCAGGYEISCEGIIENEKLNNPYDIKSPLNVRLKSSDLIELSIIGRGQNGSVIKAFHLPTFTLIALKSMNISNRSTRHQLLKELQTYSTLSSSYCVQFLGAYAEFDNVVLGNQFMNGGCLTAFTNKYKKPLKKRINEVIHQNHNSSNGNNDTSILTENESLQGLDEEVMKHIVRQVLLGLQYLHSKHQVHRDIKPDNILLDHNGAVKLSDFGLTTTLENTQAETQTFLGTLAYLSPERVCAEPYSYPSDIWSVGISIVFCATGSLPHSYSGSDFWGMVNSAKQFPTTSPVTLDISYHSQRLCDFVNQCLIVDPKLRLTATQLLQHEWLTESLNGKSIYDSSLDKIPSNIDWPHQPSTTDLDTIFQHLRNSSLTHPDIIRSQSDTTNNVHNAHNVDSNVNTMELDNDRLATLAAQFNLSTTEIHHRFVQANLTTS